MAQVVNFVVSVAVTKPTVAIRHSNVSWPDGYDHAYIYHLGALRWKQEGLEFKAA